MTQDWSERRSEPRQAASGRILLRDPARGVEWEGELVDVSPSGFRVRHSGVELCSGDRLEFRDAQRSGVAVAAWNRVNGPEVESGFYITG
jgi:hypothetical protein